jgi:glycosyltransferase involved in cell wall biosynthesis
MTKRVCIVRMGWQPFIEGPIWNLIDALNARGVASTVLKSKARADLGLPEEVHPRADCRIFPLALKRFAKIPGLRPLVLFLGWFEFNLRCVWMGRKLGAGVIIPIDIDSLLGGWLLARLTGATLIYYSWELYTDRPGIPAKPFWNAIERLLIGRADVVVACEPNRARVLQERFHLRETPMSVLNVPLRSARPEKTDRIQRVLQERGLPPSKVLYFHGWICKARCADRFVQALPKIRSNAVLFLVGPIEDAFKRELLDLAGRCGVADRVIVHGMIPSEELGLFAASADIGLQAQLNIGLNSYYCAPIKLFQYFAAGLPVIGSNFPGMLDVIEKNEAGICVDPEDVDAIAAAINRLLEDEALYQRMAENAARLAREKYCYEIEGRRLLDRIGGRFQAGGGA